MNKMSKVSKKKVTMFGMLEESEDKFFTPAKMLKNYILQIWRILQFWITIVEILLESHNTAKPLCCSKRTCHAACCKPIWVIQI